MRQSTIKIAGLIFLSVAATLVCSYLSLAGPHGKVVARVEKKDAAGYLHAITVRQFAGRFRTELSDEGHPIRDLPVSSYEFFEGSYPITSAIITWPALHNFTVGFNNGVTLDCAWNETNCVWTMR